MAHLSGEGCWRLEVGLAGLGMDGLVLGRISRLFCRELKPAKRASVFVFVTYDRWSFDIA